MTKLVIKKHRPLHVLLAIVVFSGATSAAVWFFLDTSHWQFIKDRISETQKSRSLWATNRALESENTRLKEKVIMLERTAQVDIHTLAKLQQDLLKLQDEVYRQKSELEFYRGIMSSTPIINGLAIQGIHIETTKQPQFFRYKLMLTNLSKSDTVTKVSIEMTIRGVNDSGDRVLSFADVDVDNQAEHEYEFKNFGRVEGTFAFPVDFKPKWLIVRLYEKGTSQVSVQKEFAWPVTTG